MPESGAVSPKRPPAASPLRIGLFGPFSSKNLGDTATQIAVIANLRQRHPGVEIVGICFDPADAARTHHITAADMTGQSSRMVKWGDDAPPPPPDAGEASPPGRRLLPRRLASVVERLQGLRNMARVAGSIDMLLVSGGGQIDDFWGGPWARPYELLAWSLLCRARNRTVAVFGTGIDNLTTKLGSRMAFAAMKLAHYRMFRDQETLDVLRRAGLAKPSSVGPDPAFSLPAQESWGRDILPDSQPIALVCPIAEAAWRREAHESYANYLDALVETCASLAHAGVEVQISNSQSGMDLPVVEKLAARLKDRLGAASAPRIRLASTVDEFCAIASNVQVVIASRLHGVILPLVAGTPVVAISYMRKVSRLMTDCGMADRCVDLPELTARRLTELAFDVIADSVAIKADIKRLNEHYRSLLSAEYDLLLAVARART